MIKAELKTSESRRRANKKYQQKNKEAHKYSSKKSTAKNFILKVATQEDLQEVKKWVKQREDS